MLPNGVGRWIDEMSCLDQGILGDGRRHRRSQSSKEEKGSATPFLNLQNSHCPALPVAALEFTLDEASPILDTPPAYSSTASARTGAPSMPAILSGSPMN